jgi:methionine-rich copper-binding protein CopC
MTSEPRGVATFHRKGPGRCTAQKTRPATQSDLPLSRRRLIVLTSCFAVAGTILGLREAAAHSRLVKSDPTARAVLAASPKEIRLWFNEQVEPAFAKIWIAPEKGEKVYLTSRGDPSDKNLLVATVPDDLKDGPVVIAFHVLSVDGHVIESELKFTIKHQA